MTEKYSQLDFGEPKSLSRIKAAPFKRKRATDMRGTSIYETMHKSKLIEMGINAARFVVTLEDIDLEISNVFLHM